MSASIVAKGATISAQLRWELTVQLLTTLSANHLRLLADEHRVSDGINPSYRLTVGANADSFWVCVTKLVLLGTVCVPGSRSFDRPLRLPI